MNILIADDHALVRENLGAFLSRFPIRANVVEAGTLDEAVEAASSLSSLGLIILDLMMPGMHGIAGINVMVERFPDTPIVVLSGSTRQDDIDGALQLGAKGFIPKIFSGKEMIEALRKVLDGEIFIPDMAAHANGPTREQAAPAQPQQESEEFKQLTARERQVLGFLVKGNPNKTIARELGLQEITVKVHLQNVYRKLGVSNRTHTVAKLLELGWNDSSISP